MRWLTCSLFMNRGLGGLEEVLIQVVIEARGFMEKDLKVTMRNYRLYLIV